MYLEQHIAMAILGMAMFSIIGWVYESSLYSLVVDKRFINKGFFLGPYCPIYGVVIQIAVLAYGRFHGSNTKLFLEAAVICCMVEFITSYILEALFEERWWDYSEYPFNIQGRICLPAALFFGFTILTCAKGIFPILNEIFMNVPFYIIDRAACAILLIFSADVVITLLGRTRKNRLCVQIFETVREKYEVLMENLTNALYERQEKIWFIKGREAAEGIKRQNERLADWEKRTKEQIQRVFGGDY